LAWVPLICYLLIIFISVVAQKRQVKEARILTIGFGIASVSFLIFLIIAIMDTTPNFLVPLFNPAAFFFLIYTLAPPAAVSIFLAYNFARTSKRLQDKLYEVEILSRKNVAVEREKQELLASQNLQLEAKVHERTAALNQSLDELKSAQSQLIQSAKMASLGELTAGIAHEIQNPLNFVNNFSEVNTELIEDANQEIEKGNIPDAKSILKNIKDNEEKINHHGKRADAIVKSMLKHSKSSTGAREPTNISAMAYEYSRLAFHGWRAKDKMFDVNLISEFDQSIMPVYVVRLDIGRVILNLINNAFYAVAERKKQHGSGYEPTVILSTKKSGQSVLLSIKDNGNGIPEKLLDKVFQPFFTTKPAGQGIGLGLSLSYDIVKAHNGELKVITKEGEGAEFLITLPAIN
jgi:two-component system NtrC family sensor kinase